MRFGGANKIATKEEEEYELGEDEISSNGKRRRDEFHNRETNDERSGMEGRTSYRRRMRRRSEVGEHIRRRRGMSEAWRSEKNRDEGRGGI